MFSLSVKVPLWFFASFFIITTLIIPLRPAFGLEVIAQGIDRQSAINAALRQAIDMELGTKIETRTLSENFQIVRQQILSHSRGYIKNYQVITEDQDANGMFSITLAVEVDSQNIADSHTALQSLMRMANHPRVLVAGVDEGFDALPILNPAYDDMILSVSQILKETYKFDVLDPERVRLSDRTPYRYSDRKNNLARAKRANADYVVFVELLSPKGQSREINYTLVLEAHHIQERTLLASKEHSFHSGKPQRQQTQEVVRKAQEHIHAPVTQIAASMVEQLKERVLDKGQRYLLQFNGFSAENLEFLPEDLARLTAYQSHELNAQQKKSLTLSYWSMLAPEALHRQISALLNARKMPFTFRISGSTLSYRFDDPLFE